MRDRYALDKGCACVASQVRHLCCFMCVCRNYCAPEDLYYPHPVIQDVLWWTLYQAEPLLLGSRLRKKALAECMKHIHYEVRRRL